MLTAIHHQNYAEISHYAANSLQAQDHDRSVRNDNAGVRSISLTFSVVSYIHCVFVFSYIHCVFTHTHCHPDPPLIVISTDRERSLRIVLTAFYHQNCVEISHYAATASKGKTMIAPFEMTMRG